MEFTILTETLKSMVGRAIVCASNNKLIPITSLMSIKVESGKLTIASTDATNYYYVSCDNEIKCEDFEVSVLAEQFTQLIQKTTCENTTIEIKDNSLVVKGNGTYSLELPMENNQPIKFKDKVPTEFMKDEGVIEPSTIALILAKNKASLSVGVEVPELCGYYCGGSVVTSDRIKVCKTNIKVFDTPYVLTSQLMEVLNIMAISQIHVTSNDECLVFETNTDKLYAPNILNTDAFPIVALTNLLDSEFPAHCKVSREAVVQLLDRLTLFVASYDKKAINLTFTSNGIMFSSKRSNGVELIPYVDSGVVKDYTCCVDIQYFKSLINTQNDETLNIEYGSDIALKFTTENTIQLIALMEE